MIVDGRTKTVDPPSFLASYKLLTGRRELVQVFSTSLPEAPGESSCCLYLLLSSVADLFHQEGTDELCCQMQQG